MSIKLIAAATGCAIGLLAACAGVISAVFGTGSPAGAHCIPIAATPPGPSAGPAPAGPWTPQQTANAATIVAVGIGRSVAPRGLVIALATAMQESGLDNLGDLGPDNDHDSLGLFQQRPSQGWGTPAQIMDPAYAAAKFYDRLLQVPGWQQLPLTVAAQEVQQSAFPDAYAKWEPAATQLVGHMASANGLAVPENAGHCVSIAGWTHPLPGYKINSGFRTEERPAHDGVDFAAPAGTPIRAAASGVVIKVLCNASLNGQPYSCDVSGSPAVKGCGHYLEIQTGEYIHRYCHLLRSPYVKAGEPVLAGRVIGLVGTSGNSSGPHLHLEIHKGLVASPSNAIPPQAHFLAIGVDLNS